MITHAIEHLLVLITVAFLLKSLSFVQFLIVIVLLIVVLIEVLCMFYI